MAHPQQLIEYLRRCYEADNRETGIRDLLHKKNREVHFFEGEELALSGTISRAALPRSLGERVRREAFKFRRDKTLVYAALPIVGSGAWAKRFGNRLCAPLFFFPAEVVQINGGWFLQPDLGNPRINFPVLDALANATAADGAALESFCLELPPLPWPRARLHTLAAGLAELLPQIDFSALAAFPQLVDSAALRNILNAPRDSLACLPACAMALLPNSPETRGVLFELSQVQLSPQRTPALDLLLAPTAGRSKRDRPTAECFAPAVLSQAQQAIVSASRSKPLTLVVGPPGTGKSYTIAAIALDHLARDQSVLIASRMDQAVDVVAGKIEALVGPTQAIVRAGRKEYLREMKKSLEDLLQGLTPPRTPGGSGGARPLRRQLQRLDRQLAAHEQTLEQQVQREIAWGESAASPSTGGLRGLASALLHRLRSWQLDGVDVWQDMGTYQHLLDARCEQSREFLRQRLAERLGSLLHRRREQLSKFLQALRARSDGKQQKLFEQIDFPLLLAAFPVWLCKLSDLANVLPLQAGLFDVVILDEATQCDIASCLPLLQRGKRVVVVGDPKQLRHISFLPHSRQEAIADECQLTIEQQNQFSFRTRSILDAVSDSMRDPHSVVLLNEHFRSLPSIVQFSNETFYAGALSIMRQRPSNHGLRSVTLRPVAGKRLDKGHNPIEGEALLEELARRIAAQDGPQTSRTHAAGPPWLAAGQVEPPSIGILAPLREQADYLTEGLDRYFSWEQLQRHDLLVGTAHTFQGEERDLMLLSLTADDDSHAATFRFLSDPHVLNVSVTRARHEQLIFLSFDPQRLGPQSLLQRYLASVERPWRPTRPAQRPVDTFRSQLIAALAGKPLRFWKDYAVAGVSLDLIIEAQERMLGVDLVGYPGTLSQSLLLERYRILRRAGLEVFPLSYRLWKRCPTTCVERIGQFFEMEI